MPVTPAKKLNSPLPAGLSPIQRCLTAVFVGVIFFLLVFPLLQHTFRPIRDRRLHGIPLPGEFPAITLTTFKKGSFQRRAENWFMKRHGYWGTMVRASNQLYYSLFNQISGNYGTTVLLGHEGQFFQTMHLKAFNRFKAPNKKRLENRVRQLKLLQDRLAERNVTLFTLISTNLLELYPELIPAQYTNRSRLERTSSYQELLPLLNEYGIRHFDAHKFLVDMKPEYSFRFFEPTGSHWNNVSSCRVSAVVANQLAESLGQAAPNFACKPYTKRFPPYGDDLDLVRVANLLSPEVTYQPAWYTDKSKIEHLKPSSVQALFVGGSFLFSVADRLEREGVLENYKHYFYYKEVRSNKNRKMRPLKKRKIHWENDVFRNDVIVIEANMSQIRQLGCGFIRDALQKLERQGLLSPTGS